MQHVSTSAHRVNKVVVGEGVQQGLNRRQMTWWMRGARRPIAYNVWAKDDGKQICEALLEEAKSDYLMENPDASLEEVNDHVAGWRTEIRAEQFALLPEDEQTKYFAIAESTMPRTNTEMYVIWDCSDRLLLAYYHFIQSTSKDVCGANCWGVSLQRIGRS